MQPGSAMPTRQKWTAAPSKVLSRLAAKERKRDGAAKREPKGGYAAGFRKFSAPQAGQSTTFFLRKQAHSGALHALAFLS